VTETDAAPHLPPRWFVRAAWVVHRAIYRFTPGRFGLWRPAAKKWGTLRLTTVGRKSGQKREAILGYIEDGPNLVTVAMNGWAAPEPAWWLNLLARPDAVVDLKDGPRPVRARTAEGDERDRLWAELASGSGYGSLEAYARRRPNGTAVVVLEPRAATTTA